MQDKIKITLYSIDYLKNDKVIKFISKYEDFPLHLGSFLPSLWPREGWKSLLLIAKKNNDITGIAPIRVQTKGFIRFIEVQYVLKKDMRYETIKSMFYYIFKYIKCKYLILNCSYNDPKCAFIIKSLKELSLTYKIKILNKRKVIKVNFNWEEFAKNKGSNFRSRFRKMENKMKIDHEIKVIHYDRHNYPDYLLYHIFYIESKSWKQKEKYGVNQNLLDIYNAMINEELYNDDFSWEVFILYLNNKPISYCINLTCNNYYYIVLTSYNERYKKYYPGIYVINEAIKYVLSYKKIRKIDFLTDMSFMSAWTIDRENTYQLNIWSNIIVSIYYKLHNSLIFSITLKLIPKKIRNKIIQI